MASVALVGADGAGKTSIARAVVARLPNAHYLYMGVNFEASTVMLPSTMAIVLAKRVLGRRPDISPPSPGRAGGRRGLLARIRNEARYANLIAEEWFRQAVARYHELRGRTVVFDRHFVWDYHSSFPAEGGRDAPGLRGLHDRLLRLRYPHPDLVICLDAPVELLVQRTPGGTLEDRERRRQEYLLRGEDTREFVRVDVGRPTDAVVADVLAAIAIHLRGGNAQ